jgi:hypothetical protein
MVASSSQEDPQSILAEVMERCHLPEEERRNYVRRMSRALLFEAAEVMRLYRPDDEVKERSRERP